MLDIFSRHQSGGGPRADSAFGVTKLFPTATLIEASRLYSYTSQTPGHHIIMGPLQTHAGNQPNG